MAVKAGDDGGSGAFVWSQEGTTTRLDLRGPLGAGAVSLTVAPGTLIADRRCAGESWTPTRRGPTCRRDWAPTLPWDHLRYWMLGVAAPSEAASVGEGTAAPLRVIEQSGWRLAYESFGTVQGIRLPQRFSAERGRSGFGSSWMPGRWRTSAGELGDRAVSAAGERLGRSEPWPAPGKLNLFLHVVGRRPDGYHRLQTAFQFIDFA